MERCRVLLGNALRLKEGGNRERSEHDLSHTRKPVGIFATCDQSDIPNHCSPIGQVRRADVEPSSLLVFGRNAGDNLVRNLVCDYAFNRTRNAGALS